MKTKYTYISDDDSSFFLKAKICTIVGLGRGSETEDRARKERKNKQLFGRYFFLFFFFLRVKVAYKISEQNGCS